MSTPNFTLRDAAILRLLNTMVIDHQVSQKNDLADQTARLNMISPNLHATEYEVAQLYFKVKSSAERQK